MKKLTTLLFMAMLLVSCQESLEDQAERALKDYTEKNCPKYEAETVILDSCRFERDTKTMHYFYTLIGIMDTVSVKDQQDKIHDLLLDELRNSTLTRDYKKAGFSFKYSYYSQKQHGLLLSETTLTKEDYQ
ncbi:MAG: hypothetical protein IKO17_04410 [Prevotella sp.]|jgi:PBP1b-binding outer membrane lipoprotein LpoB|nr:hypothetical protein [Prevotella sp.]MBR4566170.1 hypothetical protein [Prevotella sp.]